jgi:hypothetical protein
MTHQIAPLQFFAPLVWLDGRPLLDTIEPYRLRTFTEALYSFDETGRPRYNRVLKGVGKKNWKTTDLILAALYRLLAWQSPQGNDCLLIGNDEDQAADDLSLLKKLVACNPILDREVRVLAKEIGRLDGKGSLKILPAGDAIGAHGKVFLFLGIDEIHGYRDYALLEALSPDPTRSDVLTWITSYSPIRAVPGVPLFDMLQAGKAARDPRLYFQWYAADYTTDPDLQGEDVSAEQRANPSMASWAEPNYLEQQKARLPTSRYRRLHLNLPGSPEGAAFSAELIAAAVKAGRALPYDPRHRYLAGVDMSGGSVDDAAFAIAHDEEERTVLDLAVKQNGQAPFDPRHAVRKFAALCQEYRLKEVHGDAYGGQTFRMDFAEHGINYRVVTHPIRGARGQPSASDFYEVLEPLLNADELELRDIPELLDQLQTLVWKGGKITHEHGGHDDFANAAAIALHLAAEGGGAINWNIAGPQLCAASAALGAPWKQ